MVPLKVGTRYRVPTLSDAADGQQVEKTTGFSKKDVARSGTLEVASVTPADGEEVGIGHPIQVTFNQPVTDRATVQKALRVTATPPVEGAWYWIDDVTADYRPQAFWPANTKVELRAKLAGIDAGDGIIGGKNRNSTFSVGRAQVIQVDVVKHQLQVLQGERVVKTYDVSTGKKNWETRNGTKIVMDKERNKVWTNEAIDAKKEYRYKSKYACG
ncbi:MAG: L,D-transpeptidase [Sporichthya sp.]|nr:L,D-transpeptidase [Sporichthya sp.]